jgi:hypothetical protein
MRDLRSSPLRSLPYRTFELCVNDTTPDQCTDSEGQSQGTLICEEQKEACDRFEKAARSIVADQQNVARA